MLLQLCLVSMLVCSSGFKVLVMNTTPGRSHAILMDAVVRHLSQAGHQITYITGCPETISQQNVSIIDISENNKFISGNVLNIRAILDKKIDMTNLKFLLDLLLEVARTAISNSAVQKLLSDTNQHFDVIIAEWMYTELPAGISAIYGCPMVWLSSVHPHWMILKLIDEAPNPAYNADAISRNVIPFKFYERLVELCYQGYALLLQKLYYYAKEEQYYKDLLVPFISKRNRIAPSINDIRYNASLILGNSHVTMENPMRLPQNYKHIGGFHIDGRVKDLPENIKSIMDNSRHGVIYFSLGSNLKSKELPAEIKDGLLRVFGGLKETVLWKYEDDLLNRPDNVHVLQWAPQNSILAHPKCILFITHGGLLSTTEAIHFGVPIIGIPVFADQFINVKKAVKGGFAILVDMSYTMVSELEKAIQEMISNSTYMEKVKELSVIYHDRLVPPGAELVHWVEHVVKTRGAHHLRSPALHLPLYQKLYLDLLAVIFVLFILSLYVIRCIYLVGLYFLHKKHDDFNIKLKSM
ncbi:UDP-glucosyltransferase 2-like isoform X2 [Leptidea sinapis]|nr:UDP-glucosyltransferase 2-like isoform X2 [Leptidea sinapis]XP_050679544.1 UDP-glucosyltransferase 2-like isoform X2 [Leptidea sinapis]